MLKLWKWKTLFITLTNNYVHALMKQKKTKLTVYIVFLFLCLLLINNALLRSPFINSGLFHQGFQTLKKIKVLISFLVFGNSDETLTLIYEISLEQQLSQMNNSTSYIIGIFVSDQSQKVAKVICLYKATKHYAPRNTCNSEN